MLQWGRGHVTAESEALVEGDEFLIDASMGPRSCDRGEVGNLPCPEAGTDASMGPRSCDRGERPGPRRSRCPLASFNGAAVM